MGSRVPVIALTTGEPAGIGPEISLQAAAAARAARVVLIGDEKLLRARSDGASTGIEILHVPLAREAKPGSLDPANAGYVLALLDRALDGARDGEFDAIVTAPVQKSVINDAGIRFTGH